MGPKLKKAEVQEALKKAGYSYRGTWASFLDKFDKDMTNNCKKAVRARQIAASQNIQLNPVLMAACKMDVGRFTFK